MGKTEIHCRKKVEEDRFGEGNVSGKDFKDRDVSKKTADSAANARSGNARLKGGEMVAHEVVVSVPSSLRGLS